jgi:peptidoglycan LD-endopeptidase LytH
MARRGVVVGAALAVLALVVTAILVLTDDAGEHEPGSAWPSSISATSAIITSTADTPSPTTPAAPPATRIFPVLGDPVSYGQTHHGYPATDIFAPCGASYLAPYPGRVDEVNRVDEYDPALNLGPTRGGLSVSILGDDGVRYYGSHFSAIDEAIQP